MEDEFAALYRGLLARIEPDPLQLRRGLQALSDRLDISDPTKSDAKPLQFSQICDIGYADGETE